jgi:hypothetical protein
MAWRLVYDRRRAEERPSATGAATCSSKPARPADGGPRGLSILSGERRGSPRMRSSRWGARGERSDVVAIR